MKLLGDSEIDQIFRIFRVLGTPNSEVWPDVELLPDFKDSFPKWPLTTENLRNAYPELNDEGKDLLEVNRLLLILLRF